MKTTKILTLLTLSAVLSLSGCAEKKSETQTTSSIVSDDPIIIGNDGHAATEINWNDSDSKNSASIPAATPIPETFEGYALSESDVSENGVYTRSVSNPGSVVIDFAGDVDFDDRYSNMLALRSRSKGIAGCLDSDLLNRIKSADIFMLNNEFPYSNRGSALPDKKFTFRADPSTVNFLNDMGVDIVSLANNHAYDYGEDALIDTFETLDNAGIPYVGAGYNIDEAMRPVYYIAGGMKIAFVSATQIERSLPPDTREATETEPGVLRTLDPEKFVAVIQEAEANSDFVIVYVHWGTENVSDFEASQRDLATAYVDAGADLIIGDHPHVLQGIEYIKDVPVFYSLGNFWFNSKTLDNCVAEVTLGGGKIQSLQFIPCRQYDCSTHIMTKGNGDFERILSDMRELSVNTKIDEDGFITKP
ncbi:MAG: CapA family protein [Clostridium sp.]|nr:CapA family protein [Clostridium sp.]